MASPRLPLVSSLVAVACGLATTTTTTSRYEVVARGAVFEARSWLSADLTSRLRADAASLLADGAFRSSGLSNTARGEQGDQGFGANDRSVLAVTPELGGDVSARAEFQLAKRFRASSYPNDFIDADGNFNSSSKAAYPTGMCRFTAVRAFCDWKGRSSGLKGRGRAPGGITTSQNADRGSEAQQPSAPSTDTTVHKRPHDDNDNEGRRQSRRSSP